MTNPSRPTHDPWAHRRGEPRTFAATWILFLFAAAVLSLGAGGALGMIATDVYRTAARLMFVVAGVGVGLLWPLLRLSQEAPPNPTRAMVQDALIVGLSLQAVALPQFLPWMGAWSSEVVLALGAGFAAWSLLIAGLLGHCWSRLTQQPRWVMMVWFVLLSGTGPLITVCFSPMWAGSDRPLWAEVLLMASPITLSVEVLEDRVWSGQAALIGPQHWCMIAGVVLAGLMMCRSASGRVAGAGESA